MEYKAVIKKWDFPIFLYCCLNKQCIERGFIWHCLLSLFDLIDADNHLVNKMPQTSVNQRFLVVSHYNKGKSVNFISKSMKIQRTTIYNIIKRLNKDPTTLENRPKTGRPQKLDKFEQKLNIRKCLAQPKRNSTQLLASLELSQKVFKRYVRKLFLRNGLHAKVCTSKQFLSRANRLKR